MRSKRFFNIFLLISSVYLSLNFERTVLASNSAPLPRTTTNITNLKDDPLFHSLSFLQLDEISTFGACSRKCNEIAHQDDLRYHSPFHFHLTINEIGRWYFWHDIVLSKIPSLPLMSEAQLFELINKTPQKYLGFIWQDESKNAAALNDDTEFVYQQKLTKLLEKKVHDFTLNKEEDLATKIDLQTHAYRVLHTMQAYFAVMDAANSVAKEIAIGLTHNNSLDIVMNTAKKINSHHSSNLQRSLFKELENIAAYEQIIKRAHEIISKIARTETERIEYKNEAERERFTNIIVEKIGLLYFIKNINPLLEKNYQDASHWNLPQLRYNIFASTQSWVQYKNNNLVYNNGADFRAHKKYHLIKPWILELDRIVERLVQL